MMGLIRDITNKLWGDKPTPTPAIVKTTTVKRQSTTDNNARLVPIAGRLFADNQDVGQDIEFALSYTRADITNDYGQRTCNITNDDTNELERRGLAGNMEKAAELKALWATGMSTTDMVRYFQGRYGYGERTMKSYVAAFNAALPGGGASVE